MIGINDRERNTEAFYQVSRDIARYIHFGGYDVISEIVDSSYRTIDEISDFFAENPDLIPDNPFCSRISEMTDLYRCDKVNDMTYNTEYDFVRGDLKAYMTLCLQFVYDDDEPYISVEIRNIRKN